MKHHHTPKLTWPMVKTILISGVGFMTDAYDLFIIGIVTPMIALVYYNGHIDPLADGLVKVCFIFPVALFGRFS